MGLANLAAAIARLLEKWGGAIAAFFAGRQSKALEVEKADAERLRGDLEIERRIAGDLDDAAERERVRDAYRRKSGD